MNKIHRHQGELSIQKLQINIIANANIPKINDGDNLSKIHAEAYMVSRKHFKHTAVVLLIGFGVGMHIHMYSASYCTQMNQIGKIQEPLKWSKIAVLYENTKELDDNKLSVITTAIKSQLAYQIQNIIRLNIKDNSK